ncbi:50S ribosomal protein L6 [candidate division KSB1 bacterium]|nr:50S ribosomal protein L6 [candidate division KSB1 bacterium]RQW04917.1 MAG: 50S ribosomal protein L6 [candidate division KSB1 bacterium]
MSRVGKQPIAVPDAVTIDIKDNVVTAKGPKGELSIAVNKELKLTMQDGVLTVERPSNDKVHKSMHGLYRSLVNNIIEGVTNGFERRLEIVGVGYRAEMKGRNLFLSIGYSHDILFKPSANIELSTEGNNAIIVRGIDKVLVGQVAAKIRAFRPPEPYKGKGIRYAGEVVRRKAGKTAA